MHHAYANAPAVRSILDRAGISPAEIEMVADLERIPVTSKDRLVELQAAYPPFGGFLAVPFDTLQHIFLSPGPLYEPHAGESAITDTIYEILAIAGIETGDVVINTFGYHLIPTGLAIDEALRKIGATVIPAGVGNADLQIKMMRELNVTCFVGTPSWLMALIKKAREMNLNFRELSMRKVLVSAEPLPPDLRQTFVEEYGLQVTNAYGTAELGFLAFDSEGALPMRLLTSAIVQIANPETGESVPPGEVGEVVVTSFNETYPLVRLGTGDLAINVDPAPGVSKQGDRSIILVGRVGDAVKIRGMFVHPNQLRFAVARIPGIAQFQAVVARPENRDELTLRIAPADMMADRQALTEALTVAIQSACRVKVDHFEFLEVGDLDEKANILLDERRW
jgi:phenylacetate-CoA ligase